MDRYFNLKYHINRKCIWLNFITILLKERVTWTEFLDLKSLFHFSHKSSIFPESQEIGVDLYQIYVYKTWAVILEIGYQDHGKCHLDKWHPLREKSIWTLFSCSIWHVLYSILLKCLMAAGEMSSNISVVISIMIILELMKICMRVMVAMITGNRWNQI